MSSFEAIVLCASTQKGRDGNRRVDHDHLYHQPPDNEEEEHATFEQRKIVPFFFGREEAHGARCLVFPKSLSTESSSSSGRDGDDGFETTTRRIGERRPHRRRERLRQRGADEDDATLRRGGIRGVPLCLDDWDARRTLKRKDDGTSKRRSGGTQRPSQRLRKLFQQQHVLARRG